MSFHCVQSATMIDEHHGVTRDELISEAFEILEQAKTGTPVFDTHGQPILHDGEPIMVRDHESANRAMEVIGRLAGFWIERREIVTFTRPRTEDELRAELARVEAEIAKRKNGKVVELRAVGGKDGEIPVAG